MLINGKRQTIAATRANDGSVFVDTSTIPVAALERIEILKEGATAAYGSDAVAGVVNFILRKDFDGFEVSGGYQTTSEDAQDTTEASFLWGFGNETAHITLAGALMRQDSLNGSDRSYLVNNAVSTLGRSFILTAPDAVAGGDYAGTYAPGENVPDPNCAANGGLIIPQASGSRCGFAYGVRFNVVNEEERDQLYGNITHEFSETLSLTAELGYTHHEVVDNPQSPTYPNLAFPVILPGQAGSRQRPVNYEPSACQHPPHRRWRMYCRIHYCRPWMTGRCRCGRALRGQGWWRNPLDYPARRPVQNPMRFTSTLAASR